MFVGLFTPPTFSIENLNAKLRRAVRSRGHLPTDEAALKLLFLVLNLAAKEWKMPPREWAMAKAQLAILFEDRLPWRYKNGLRTKFLTVSTI
jgi:transposase-like protein